MSSNDQVLQQTETIWKFLDNLSIKNPKEYQQFIDKILKDGADNNLGPPVAQFAVQSNKLPEVIPVRNYYLNFAAWPQLPKPETESSPIAIATSDIRKEVVLKEWAYVIDIALNPITFPPNDDANQTAKCVLIELAFRHVESKFSLKLSRKHKMLDEKYIGNMDNLLNFMCPTSLKSTLADAVHGVDKNLNFEQIKKFCHDTGDTNANKNSQQKSSIDQVAQGNKQSVSSNNVHNNELKELKTVSNKQQNNQQKDKLARPKVEMIVNKETSRVDITVYLPLVESVQECDLDLAENSLSLYVPEKYKLNLPLPVTIDIDDSKAKFVKDQKILLVDARSKT